MGDQLGFADTRGTLFFQIERILRDKEPEAFLLENVKQLVTHDRGRTFKVIQEHLINLGYNIHFSVLNALDFGLPQKRRESILLVLKTIENLNSLNQREKCPTSQAFWRMILTYPLNFMRLIKF